MRGAPRPYFSDPRIVDTRGLAHRRRLERRDDVRTGPRADDGDVPPRRAELGREDEARRRLRRRDREVNRTITTDSHQTRSSMLRAARTPEQRPCPSERIADGGIAPPRPRLRFTSAARGRGRAKRPVSSSATAPGPPQPPPARTSKASSPSGPTTRASSRRAIRPCRARRRSTAWSRADSRRRDSTLRGYRSLPPCRPREISATARHERVHPADGREEARRRCPVATSRCGAAAPTECGDAWRITRLPQRPHPPRSSDAWVGERR